MPSRTINCVTLDLTTRCDRKCPDCCAGIGVWRTAVAHSWEYLEEAARYLYGVHRLNLTGGEPLMHPEFDSIVPRLRGLFGCHELTLSTNGYHARAHVEALRCFDYIHASLYATNIEEVAFLRSHFDTRVFSGDFIPRERRGSGAVCFRGLSDTVAHADGKLYGCCVAPGVQGARGAVPTKTWRQDVLALPLPCIDCWFSPEA